MVSIHEAAEFLGVTAQMLRRWEREGKLIPDERTPGSRRRYNLERARVAASIRSGLIEPTSC